MSSPGHITVPQAVALGNEILGRWGTLDIPRVQAMIRREVLAGYQDEQNQWWTTTEAVQRWAVNVKKKRSRRR